VLQGAARPGRAQAEDAQQGQPVALRLRVHVAAGGAAQRFW
jgi:hypothetical protein